MNTLHTSMKGGVTWHSRQGDPSIMPSPGATRHRGLRRRLRGDRLAGRRCAGTLDGGSDPEGRNVAGCRIFGTGGCILFFFGREGRRLLNTSFGVGVDRWLQLQCTNSFEDVLGASSSQTDMIWMTTFPSSKHQIKPRASWLLNLVGLVLELPEAYSTGSWLWPLVAGCTSLGNCWWRRERGHPCHWFALL